MRIFIKGGTWKNTEDEILKAAVMKYGKNQWARIASLLTRKSAKQCKARWYEWLDPGIKKTEWTKDEEEKLVHLAKLMPCQWRSIAPIVGRTAAQCLEHYEKLVDQTQEKDESYDPENDPRRLRPGEIDPAPEVKPAKPDALDMDEDEKEMLSEARARLANTKGKKAKRKARERQLEEARRLAALQKRREMKAAGIEMPVFERRKIKNRGIDYNKEIPFARDAVAGPFDTGEEEAETEGRKLDPTFHHLTLDKLEGKKRDQLEKDAMKKDKKKQEDKQKRDLAGYFEEVNKHNDPESQVRRSALVMPSPQIGDGELQALAKMGTDLAAPAIAATPQAGATPTPFQTPGTPAPGQTPRGGMTPRGGPGGATPRLGPGESREERRAAMQQRNSIQRGLDRMPRPKNDYELQLNLSDEQRAMLDEADPNYKTYVSPDAAEEAQAMVQARKRQEEDRFKQQSQVVQRDLPRPHTWTVSFGATDEDPVEAELAKEMAALVAYDAAAHPAGGKKKRKRNMPELEYFNARELHTAREMLRTELHEVQVRSTDFTRETDDAVPELADSAAFVEAWEECQNATILLPNPRKFVPFKSATLAEKVAALRHQYESAKARTINLITSCGSSEKRLKLVTGGYVARNEALKKDCVAVWEELESANLELSAFTQLHENEQAALHRRLTTLTKEVEVLREEEKEWQAKYQDLKRQMETD